jgi:hypothetical protein
MSRGNRHLASRQARALVQRLRRRRAIEAEAATAEAIAEARGTLLEIRCAVFAMPEASRSDAVGHLLASPGWIIGLGATVAHEVDPGSILARRLHGALRTVQGMCLAAYTWRSVNAPALELAAVDAHALLIEHADLALRAKPEGPGSPCESTTCGQATRSATCYAGVVASREAARKRRVDCPRYGKTRGVSQARIRRSCSGI